MTRRPSILAVVALTAAIAGVAPLARAGFEVGETSGRKTAVRFTYRPDRAVKTVHLAGSFNGWSKSKHRLADANGDGVWETTIELERGRWLYKFVIDGKDWVADAGNPERTEDGFGAWNSVALVGDEGALVPDAKRGDGLVARTAVVHDPTDRWFRIRWKEDRAIVRLRARPNDLEAVTVVAGEERVAAHRLLKLGGGEWWEALLQPRPGRALRYHFEVRDGDATLWVDRKGVREDAPRDGTRLTLPPRGRRSGGEDQVAAIERFETPEWAADAVFYQIFPERFKNGDPENDPETAVPWGSRKPHHDTFYGGDLDGVRQELDYLRGLGVNAIYFNPVFLAESNHKYDTGDYMEVDPAFGTNETLKKLVTEAHERGIRVILDGVFNHTGDEFWAFEDIKKRERKSKYLDWYFVRDFPIVVKKDPGYDCWWGYGDLPKLNTDNAAVREHLLDVATHWIEEADVDGWRLDVPNEVPHDFWIEFRRRVKKARPDALIVGEIWEDASAWLGGDQFDSVMNYVVRGAILDFAINGSGSPARYDARLAEQRLRYPPQATYAMFNLLGSHDTERVLTLAGGDRTRARLALGLLYGYVGSPVVYYGDEVSMEGGKDPDCRRCFPWDEAKQDLVTRDLVTKLAAIRAERRALRRGWCRTVHVGSDGQGTWAQLREEPGRSEEAVLVVANARPSERTVRIPMAEIGGAFASAADVIELVGLAGASAVVEGEELVVTLPARGFAYVATR